MPESTDVSLNVEIRVRDEKYNEPDMSIYGDSGNEITIDIEGVVVSSKEHELIQGLKLVGITEIGELNKLTSQEEEEPELIEAKDFLEWFREQDQTTKMQIIQEVYTPIQVILAQK